MKFSISVIIPNYNHAAFLRQRIDCILGQTLPPDEIIILDDCSSDTSIDIIEEYISVCPLIKFFPNQINSGSTFAQWNKGVQLARSELIWIAESDDFASPDFLKKVSTCFETDDEVVLAYCQSHLVDGNGTITGIGTVFTEDNNKPQFARDFLMDGPQYIERYLIHRNTIPNGSAVIFKKSVYEGVGAIPEDLKHTGDWLAWLKMLCYGKLCYLSEPLNSFRRHSESVIAKAHLAGSHQGFKDWYGLEVRSWFLKFLKQSNTKLLPAAQLINAKYMATDEGNLGLYHLQTGRVLKGWQLILRSSFFPTPQSGFIKKALFKK